MNRVHNESIDFFSAFPDEIFAIPTDLLGIESEMEIVETVEVASSGVCQAANEVEDLLKSNPQHTDNTPESESNVCDHKNREENHPQAEGRQDKITAGQDEHIGSRSLINESESDVSDHENRKENHPQVEGSKVNKLTTGHKGSLATSSPNRNKENEGTHKRHKSPIKKKLKELLSRDEEKTETSSNSSIQSQESKSKKKRKLFTKKGLSKMRIRALNRMKTDPDAANIPLIDVTDDDNVNSSSEVERVTSKRKCNENKPPVENKKVKDSLDWLSPNMFDSSKVWCTTCNMEMHAYKEEVKRHSTTSQHLDNIKIIKEKAKGIASSNETEDSTPKQDVEKRMEGINKVIPSGHRAAAFLMSKTDNYTRIQERPKGTPSSSMNSTPRPSQESVDIGFLHEEVPSIQMMRNRRGVNFGDYSFAILDQLETISKGITSVADSLKTFNEKQSLIHSSVQSLKMIAKNQDSITQVSAMTSMSLGKLTGIQQKMVNISESNTSLLGTLSRNETALTSLLSYMQESYMVNNTKTEHKYSDSDYNSMPESNGVGIHNPSNQMDSYYLQAD